MNARVSQLPRRDWRDTADVEALTQRFKTPAGTQTLRTIQAAALSEAPKCGGLFLHGRVGCGKTLTAALLAEAMGATRALLIVRGGDVEDTKKQHTALRVHWKIPRTLRVIGYEWLSNPTRADWLDRHPPDLIICDEGHKLKDILKSVCAIKVSKFLAKNPHVKFCVMSGTLSPHGDLKDYAHLLLWALRNRAPIPTQPGEINQWRRALEGTGNPKVLGGSHNQDEGLYWFKERMRTAPGVIISDDIFNDVPLAVSSEIHDAPEDTREAYQQLRDFWEAPDGWSYGDDYFQVAASARQYANGFYYHHVPRPPDWFLKKRKAWTSHCRTLIEAGIAESEGQIKLSIINGHTKDGAKELDEWLEAEASFPLRTQADWLSIEPLLYAKQWAKPHGIIWVGHIEVGEALEKISGLPFYHGQKDRNILHEDGSRCVIASIQANGTSKNLQGPFDRGVRAGPFYHNLILAPPANGQGIEQLIGRTHREDQIHPVTVEFYIACREHRNAVMKSIYAAERITDTLSPQKMAGQRRPALSHQDHPAWQQAQKVTE